jgi:membrane protein
MVWIQLVTVVLLIGYEINASIHHAIRREALWNARKYRRQSPTTGKIKSDSDLYFER